MNKCCNSLIFIFAVMFTQAAMCVNAPAAFAKLTSKITKNAEPWSQNVVDTLDTELQLAWANFFALLQDGQPSKALMKCAEYIEAHQEMVPSSQQLALSTIQTLQEYSEKVEEKIARKKDLSEEEEESLFQKLEDKIQELVAYINAIYYEHIYSHIMQKNSSTPLFMFDENGVILQEKRTRSLPKPE